MEILNKQHEQLLNDEKAALEQLYRALKSFNATDVDLATLDDSIRQLDDFFLLVIVGEYNTGKSSFINALLGEKILAEGNLPTTQDINILRYGDVVSDEVTPEKIRVITAPAEVLRDISIVDTPGANAIFREHEELTTDFVPRSDLVLFLISADRAFSESERAFLAPIRDWGKKVVVVLNKIDYVQNEDERTKIVEFIRQSTRETLGIDVEIFPISALQAFKAKTGEPDLWPSSQFEPLERYIKETLDEASRLKLKLANPVGVGTHLTSRYLGAIDEQSELLAEDLMMLNNVEGQMTTFETDMKRDFDLHLKGVDNILLEMEQRGRDFFDSIFRISKVWQLTRKEEIQRGFEEQVTAGVPEQIERKVNEIIDWLVDADLRQWQAVNDYLAERRRAHQANLIGDDANASFRYERERLFEQMTNEVSRVVQKYDRKYEAELLADGAQSAVATLAMIEVGAIGLGAAVAAIAATAAADATGIILGSVVAALGLFVIPARRRSAERDFREKIATMRKRIVRTLNQQFTGELERIMQRHNTAIAPYARFVRTETGKLENAKTSLSSIEGELAQIKARVDKL